MLEIDCLCWVLFRAVQKYEVLGNIAFSTLRALQSLFAKRLLYGLTTRSL